MTPNDQRIEEAAAHWAIRLAEADLPPPEQQELREWLQADSRHSGALLLAQATWHDLNRLDALAGRPIGGHGPARDAQAVSMTTPERGRHAAATGLAKFPRLLLAIAASVVLTVAAGILAFHNEDLTGDRYTAAVGGTASVPLPDGSQILLNTGSQVRVAITPKERRIELQQGEAFFAVAKDKARPFVVRAAGKRIIAVGTHFSVRRDGKVIQVVVTEGTVRLESADRARPLEPDNFSTYRLDAGGAPAADRGDIMARAEVSVTPGEIAWADADGRVTIAQLAPSAVQRRLAWRDGNVEFAGEPLRQAIAEINRHNKQQVVIDDPVLAERPIMGVFPANDPAGFATTVAVAIGARCVNVGAEIHLVRTAEANLPTK